MEVKLFSDQKVDHEGLAVLFTHAIAAQVRESLRASGRDQEDIWSDVEAVTFDLAMLLDEATFVVNGQVFRPRISFVAEDGRLLDGAAGFDHLHEYATIFEDDLEPTDDFSITV